jgi:hypothetical protein
MKQVPLYITFNLIFLFILSISIIALKWRRVFNVYINLCMIINILIFFDEFHVYLIVYLIK